MPVYARAHSNGSEADMRSMRKAVGIVALCGAFMGALALTSCGGGGGIKRVSEPSVGIQQLTVRPDGQWSVDLRIDNFSSVPMTFGSMSLEITVGGESAGTLTASPGLAIGPESADVATATLTPSSAARIAVADALAGRKSVSYALSGTLGATPDQGKARTFQVKRDNQLNPVPGLPGVLR
jgi:hypothetical protein